MIVILLAIYKSCTKFHENIYDPVIPNLHQYEQDYIGYDSAQFPAPPPPYGFRSASPTTTQQIPTGTQPNLRPESTDQVRTTNTTGNLRAGATTAGITGYVLGRR